MKQGQGMYDAGDGRMARRWVLGSVLMAAAVAAVIGATVKWIVSRRSGVRK